MEVSIEKKGPFAVAGINKWLEDPSECPAIWDTLYEKFLHGMLEKIGDGSRYGVAHGHSKNEDGFYYLAGYDVKNIEEAKILDMDVEQFEAAEYAVLELKGPVVESIERGWHHLHTVFFQQTPYELFAELPQIEVYHEGDITDPEYTMELWVPVRKKV